LRVHARPASQRSPSTAVSLSALWPGLGQWYLGQPRTAAILAIPPLLTLIPLLASGARGAVGLFSYLVVPENAALLAVATATSLAFRLISIGLARATFMKSGLRPRRRTLWGIIGVVVVAHLAAMYAAIGLFGVTSRVFSNTIPQIADPVVPAPSSDVIVGVLPSVSAVPTDQRFTVLLVGSDFGTGYTHSLTDTMIVVSVDPATKSAVMASVPRDTARFPMYDGSKYDGKLNSLMTAASKDPAKYPDGGIGTLAHEIGYLVGVPIQYVAYINLGGFSKLVDAVGGVDVVVTQRIDDANYEFDDGARGFHMTAGPHHLNGRLAAAFVRSRYGIGDNDFTRARRQQQLLVALKDRLLSPAILPNLPTVLDAASRLVTTNFPPNNIEELVTLSQSIPETSIERFVLGPPYATNPANASDYILVPDMARYAKWSIKEFGAASRYSSN